MSVHVEEPSAHSRTSSLATSATLSQIVARFAPVVYFDPSDPYRLASVDWYMARTEFHAPSLPAPLGVGKWSFSPEPGPGVQYVDPKTPDGLVVTPWSDDSGTERGDQDSAPLYVHVRPVAGHDDQIDIQYWFFYPFNGNEILRLEGVRTAETSIDISQHQGDWEHVTVRVSLVNDGSIVAVLYAAHSGGGWVTQRSSANPEGFDTENGHPKVYVAAQTHASYPIAGGPFEIGAFRGLDSFVDILLVDYTSGDGPPVDFTDRCTIVRNDATRLFADEGTNPSWLAFTGRWGDHTVLFPSPEEFGAWLVSFIKSSPQLAPVAVLVGPWGFELDLALWAQHIIGEDSDGPENPPIKGSWADEGQPFVWTRAAGFSGPHGSRWATRDTAALVIGRDGPMVIHRATSQRIVCAASFDATTQQWSADLPLHGILADSGIAATVIPGGGAIAVVALLDGILRCWAGDAASNTWAPAQGWLSPAATTGAAIVQAGTTAVCAFGDKQGALHILTTRDWQTWQDRGAVSGATIAPPDPAPFARAPALGVAGSALVAVFIDQALGKRPNIGLSAVTSTDNGVTWSETFPLAPQSGPATAGTDWGPTVATLNNRLYCAWASYAPPVMGRIRFASTLDGEDWTVPQMHPSSSGNAPTLLGLPDGLMLIHMDAKYNLHWSQSILV
jgi:VPS62-like protein